jgi:uncharacterized protein (TIGR00369 family)
MKEAKKGCKPALSAGELEDFLRTEFPQVFNQASGVSIEEVWHGGALVRQAYRQEFIRPGGTISGPTMMALADFAMYVAVLAAIGPVPLAVTTNLNINFLRKPAEGDLLAEAKLMKIGKRLAVGEVAIRRPARRRWSPTSPPRIPFRARGIADGIIIPLFQHIEMIDI